MEVSKEMARLFKDQCIGSHNGHMSTIPNNPLLYSIFYAISGQGMELNFADALIAIGNQLKKEQL